jgi:hypothetical protein
MRTLVWAAVSLSAFLTATSTDGQEATTPDVCPEGQMHGADGQCTLGTGTSGTGSLGGGTAAVEAAKGGAAAEPNRDNAPADASQLGPGAVGPSTGDNATPDAGAGPAAGDGNSQ